MKKRRVYMRIKKMRVILCIMFLMLVMNFGNSVNAQEVSEVASGKCGEDIVWSLDDNGLLAISGSGKMYDYGVSTDFKHWGDDKKVKNVSINGDIENIGQNAFLECYNLTSINIPDSVTSIGDYAFSGCSGLRSITISNSVTSIGDYAFNCCSGLISINIPDSVTSIGDSAFEHCSSLEGITIPNSVTSIGDAFSYCSSLESITLPDNVTSIKNLTFANCVSLTSVRFPDSIVNIGESAFANCINLKYVFYKGTSAQWNSIIIKWYNNDLITSTIHYSATDHTWNSDYTIDIESTYTVEGSKSIHCSVCDVIKENSSVSIPIKKRIEATGKFALLKSFLQEFGQIDDNGNKYFHDIMMVSDQIGAISTITYLEDEAKFQFAYGNLDNKRVTSMIAMLIDENGSQTVTVDYNHVTFSLNASATFDASHYMRDREEYFEKTSSNILENSQIQDICNATLKSAFTGWDMLFLQYFGFDVNMADMGFTSYEQAGTHTWDDGYVTKEATTTSQGEKIYTCIVCNETKIEVIPKLTETTDNNKTPGVTNNKARKFQNIQVATSKKISVKKVEKKAQSFKLSAQSTSGNRVKYQLVKRNKNIKFAASAGKITVKKGTKKGTYKIKVKMTVSGNDAYHAYSTTKMIKIKVK